MITKHLLRRLTYDGAIATLKNQTFRLTSDYALSLADTKFSEHFNYLQRQQKQDWILKHGDIKYLKEDDKMEYTKLENIDSTFYMDRPIFSKEERYDFENEYRFCLENYNISSLFYEIKKNIFENMGVNAEKGLGSYS